MTKNESIFFSLGPQSEHHTPQRQATQTHWNCLVSFLNASQTRWPWYIYCNWDRPWIIPWHASHRSHLYFKWTPLENKVKKLEIKLIIYLYKGHMCLWCWVWGYQTENITFKSDFSYSSGLVTAQRGDNFVLCNWSKNRNNSEVLEESLMLVTASTTLRVRKSVLKMIK